MRNSIKQNNNTGFQTGFTMVEALVASAIFIATLVIIYGIFFSGLDVWGTGSAQADLQAQARTALNYMLSELRNATRTSTQVPSPNLSIPPLPNNYDITLYLPEDIDGDGLITDANGQIEYNTGNPIQYRYFLAENEIRRLDNFGQTVFARDVADIQFIDINIDPTLSLNELRIILTLNRTTERQRSISITLSSIVALRN